MRLLVGIVSKAQGVKGELKVNCMLDDASQLEGVTQLYISNTSRKVLKFRAQKNVFYVLLEGILDRNNAETYRDWEIYADKESVNLPSNSYFIQDLLQCSVYTNDGALLGKVADISQHGSADVYTVVGDNGSSVSFPWLNAIIVSVDIDSYKIVLDSEQLSHVMVNNNED